MDEQQVMNTIGPGGGVSTVTSGETTGIVGGTGGGGTTSTTGGTLDTTGGTNGTTGPNGTAGTIGTPVLQGVFVPTGSMTVARSQHTATMLPSGKVLITGGLGRTDESGALASAELYDPAAGTFTATGSMSAPRWGHTATLLGNGKVLVAGGSPGVNGLASAEIYDPTAGTFTATGSMTVAREFHTATLLSDGKVLIVGGVGLRPVSAELYDAVAGTFTATDGRKLREPCSPFLPCTRSDPLGLALQ
jgi:Galactose oxidase, central domain